MPLELGIILVKYALTTPLRSFLTNRNPTKPEQIGALAEALFRAEELGRGKTAGYGKITIDRVELVERRQQRQIVKTESGLEKKITIQEQKRETQLHDAYAVWEAYKENYRSISKKQLATALAGA